MASVLFTKPRLGQVKLNPGFVLAISAKPQGLVTLSGV